MAQHHHVPKFGNWEKEDNVPYTAYFENARKEKGGRMMNPNDPEQNPEAFNLGTPSSVLSFGSHESDQSRKQQMERKASSSTTGNHKSVSSESVSSDRSSSDQSLSTNPTHGRSKTDRKKTLHSLSSSVSTHSRLTSSVSYQSTATHQRTASVPKFGVWDEADPSSGDGFTIIFDKVKEEKHQALSQVPIVSHRPNNNNFDNHRVQGSSSSKSKFCCCFYPRRHE